ncbi:MAG: HEAT repeat domain-containing protein, partial [Verrucomicrobiaceae bacterium]
MLDPKQTDNASVQVGLRELGKTSGTHGLTDISAMVPWLEPQRDPRVRLEAFRALARVRTFESADLVLRNMPTDPGDSFLDFAAWTTVNELSRPWLEELAAHPEKIIGREKLLNTLTQITDPVVTGPYVQRLSASKPIDAAGSGPWIELIGKSGGVAELSSLYSALIKNGAMELPVRLRIVNALVEAAHSRNLRPEGDLTGIAPLIESPDHEMQLAGIRLAGEWHQEALVAKLAGFAGNDKDDSLRGEALKALRLIGQAPTVEALKKLVAEDRPFVVRRGALVPLSIHDSPEALKVLPAILKQTPDQTAAVALWAELFQNAKFVALMAKDFPKDLTPEAYTTALQAARGMGNSGKALIPAISPLAGAQSAPRDFTAEIASLVKAVQSGGDPAEGEMVYRRNACIACHAIGGIGGNFGPDFSSIGASAPLDYIIESTLNPAAKVKEGYHGFAFTMKDGSVMNGIPARETATEVIIRPAPGAEIALVKANIVKKENIGSLM